MRLIMLDEEGGGTLFLVVNHGVEKDGFVL